MIINGKVGTTLHFELDYRTFLDLSQEEKSLIDRQINAERKTPFQLEKRLQQGSMHKNAKHNKESVKITAEGETRQEIFENLKKEIWNRILAFRIEYQPEFELNVSDIRFWRNDNNDKFEAECICEISRMIDDAHSDKKMINNKEIEH